ncbi:hypothetical protein [Halocatena salina]|uniref:Uncharacterized protein n=1 Tax=Halocatena salina TaxID=2934340 RepID=A0A8U0A6G9_9EURY|nr:hypothetical protein [Halocatena salina]UPM44459.1 hypothetical protein MW046_13520 [Halocatena salina]
MRHQLSLVEGKLLGVRRTVPSDGRSLAGAVHRGTSVGPGQNTYIGAYRSVNRDEPRTSVYRVGELVVASIGNLLLWI